MAVTTDVPHNERLPLHSSLEQSYPNPFSNVATIRYAIDHRGAVTIHICDALGRVVARPVNAIQDVGAYQVDFSGAGFPAGVYECVLHTPRNTVRQIMQLIK